MLVKCKVKEYPDGTKKAYVYKEPYPKDELLREKKLISSSYFEKDDESIEQDKLHSEHMNMVRTRNQIKDYVLSNDFNMFWTLTFDTDRETDQICFNKLSNWLKYMKTKFGLFEYIFIPERHKDGCLHFHGVTGRFKGSMVDSGVRYKGVKIYNCNDWNYGFSTVSMVRSKKKTSSYITKYIIKSLSQDIVGKGKKKYWSSRGLRKPEETYYQYVPFEDLEPDWQSDNVSIYNL
jgi:hypothetical protein